MVRCAVSAIGRDRPGIVAAITGVLFELGGNIEDSQMSILRGHFSVMLIVALPEGGRDAVGAVGLDPGRLLAERLATVKAELELEAVTVSRVDDLAGTAPHPTHILSVYGADHPGIVHAVSTALADRGISITGLETKLAGSGDSPLYVMLIEVAAGEADLGELSQALGRVGSDSGLEVSLRELDETAL